MLDTLRDQLGRPIEIMDALSLPQALHDRFVETFIQTIEANQRYFYPNKEVNFIVENIIIPNIF